MESASASDVDAVRALLGRDPTADFEVEVRDSTGAPVVLRNAAFTRDGRPMPTRFWLVDPVLVAAVSRIEAAGGVKAAAAVIPADVLADAHERYAAERDATIPAGHVGPRPTGGVGGTHTGVKCLHAHYAWTLAGGDDPVGRWVGARLAEDPPG
ncbi:MAG: DUF501 domain-containing protein [Acidimicrobiia bacterium]